MLALLAASALAVPVQFNHQGRLLDASGVPLAGQQDVTFKLYASQSAPTSFWEDSGSIDFDDGYYAAVLGDSALNPIEEDDVDGNALYLTLTVGTGTESDRMAVLSVPYAVRANTATNVMGGLVDASEIRVDGTTVIDSSGSIVAALPGTTLDDLTCSNGEVPLFNGTSWGCAAPGGAVSWGNITGVPLDIADGDDDALSALVCTQDEVAEYNVTTSSWVCGTDDVLDEGTVDTMVADNGFALDADVHALGKSGSWTDLLDIPSDIDDGDDGFTTEQELTDLLDDNYLAAAYVPDWSVLTGIPGDIADGDQVGFTTEQDLTDLLDDNYLAASYTPAWGSLTGIPGDIADGDDDTVLTEAEVETFVTNGALDLDPGTTIGGSAIPSNVFPGHTAAEPFMGITTATTTATGTNLNDACHAQFGNQYSACTASQYLALYKLFLPEENRAWIWVSQGSGAESEADNSPAVFPTRACCGSQNINNYMSCPNGQSFAGYSSTAYLPWVECQGTGNTRPVVCCRRH